MKRNVDSAQAYPVKSLSAIVSAICAGVPAAHAQEAAQEEGREVRVLEEVTVTATKREENLQDIAVTVQALGESKLEELKRCGVDRCVMSCESSEDCEQGFACSQGRCVEAPPSSSAPRRS